MEALADHGVVLLVQPEATGVSSHLHDSFLELLLVLGKGSVILEQGQVISPQLVGFWVACEGLLVKVFASAVDVLEPVGQVEREAVEKGRECLQVLVRLRYFMKVFLPASELLTVPTVLDLTQKYAERCALHLLSLVKSQ